MPSADSPSWATPAWSTGYQHNSNTVHIVGPQQNAPYYANSIPLMGGGNAFELPPPISPIQPYRPTLTSEQLETLMRDHAFIAMNHSDYCLFCAALSVYRTETEHVFVICEE